MFWNPCSCSGWQRTQSQPSVSSFLASRFNFYLSGFNSSQRETFNTWYVHHNFSPPWPMTFNVSSSPGGFSDVSVIPGIVFTSDIAGVVLHLLNICCIESWTFCRSQVLKKIQLPVSVVLPGLHCIAKLPSLAPCHQQGWAHWMRGHICDC